MPKEITKRDFIFFAKWLENRVRQKFFNAGTAVYINKYFLCHKLADKKVQLFSYQLETVS